MKKWNCPSSKELDCYILDQDNINNKNIIAHLRDCPYCQLYVKQCKIEFDELQADWYKDECAYIIRLLPLTNSSKFEDENHVLLAAEGKSKLKEPESLTLVSSDEKVLIRAIRDQRTADIWLYIIPDDESFAKNVLVKPFGLKKEYIPDNQSGKYRLAARKRSSCGDSFTQGRFHISPYRRENS